MDSLGQPKLVALTRSSTLSRGTAFLLEDNLNFIVSEGSHCLCVCCHMTVHVTGCDFAFFLACQSIHLELSCSVIHPGAS